MQVHRLTGIVYCMTGSIGKLLQGYFIFSLHVDNVLLTENMITEKSMVNLSV